MFSIFKFLKLPTPKELGYKNDFLGMREIQKHISKNEYTWEDHDEYLKKIYPRRYWILHTVPMWFRVNVFMPIEYKWYDFKSYLRKDHLLDLRQSKGNNGINLYKAYRIGKLRPSEALLYSWVKIITNMMINHKFGLNDDNAEFKKLEDDVRNIVYYWDIGRQKMINEIIKIYKSKDLEKEQKKQSIFLIENDIEIKDQEILTKILKIRPELDNLFF